ITPEEIKRVYALFKDTKRVVKQLAGPESKGFISF
uniref:Uncharacterized protein n=1 Tax=Panagrolaimus sp. JU765 TaxID=591449 RepID=A0AC34QUE6_9BILA